MVGSVTDLPRIRPTDSTPARSNPRKDVCRQRTERQRDTASVPDSPAPRSSRTSRHDGAESVPGREVLTSDVGLPWIGSTYDVTVSRAAASTFAVLLSGLSDTTYQGAPLPSPLPGAPGCDLQASADVSTAVIVSPTGTASSPISVPSSASLMGLPLFHQWAVLDSVNSLGLVVSDAGKATVGI